MQRLVLALVLVAVAHRVARAEPAALFVGGSVSAADRDDLRAVALEVVQGAGWNVTVPDLDDRELAEIVDCARSAAGGDCLPERLDALDVDRAIVLSIDREGKKGVNARAAGWVFRRSGEQIAVDQRHCEPCDAKGLRDTVKELTTVLMRDARAAVAPSTVEVRSSPDGARVSIDSEFVGLTNLEHKVYAGPHTIEIAKDGYRTETRDVVVGDGERTPIEVTLEKTGDTSRVEPRRRSFVPWVLVATGGVQIVGGGVLVLIDEDGVGDDGAAIRRHDDSATVGWVTLGVGAAVATAGIVWLWRTRHGKKEHDEAHAVSPIVDVREDAALVGIGGRF